MRRQKCHHIPGPTVFQIGLGYLFQFRTADPPDFQQPFRLLIQYREGIHAKGIKYPFRHDRTDSLNLAGGQIGDNALF